MSIVAAGCALGSGSRASENRSVHHTGDRFASVGAADAREDPLDSLRRTSATLGGVLHRRMPDWSPEAPVLRGQADAILEGILDYEQIARGALGTEWDKLTDAQRRDFLRAFSALTNQAFVAAMNRPEVHLRFDSETIQGDVASVAVTASGANPTAEGQEHMEYRLAKKADRWLIRDVLVDGVSLVEGYRDQFARLLRRGGYPELIERMHRKLESSQRY